MSWDFHTFLVALLAFLIFFALFAFSAFFALSGFALVVLTLIPFAWCRRFGGAEGQ